jgi:hypothetical protein
VMRQAEAAAARLQADTRPNDARIEEVDGKRGLGAGGRGLGAGGSGLRETETVKRADR